jgi:succinyl-CoA synthetase beta subunit
MIAQGARIAEEYYFSILLDRANRTYLAMCSKEGGMDIEQLAVERPEKLAKIAVDPNVGIDDGQGPRDRRRGRLRRRDRRQDRPCSRSSGTSIRDEDATLVEVNPLVKTEDGDIVALDGKVSLDDNADFRHPDHEALEDTRPTDPLEAAAKEKDLNYVKLDGIGRHHRQRCGPGHEHPRRRRLRRRGVHRWQSPSRPTSSTSAAARSAEVMANGLHIILVRPAGQGGLRQRLRRHHRL